MNKSSEILGIILGILLATGFGSSVAYGDTFSCDTLVIFTDDCSDEYDLLEAEIEDISDGNLRNKINIKRLDSKIKFSAGKCIGAKGKLDDIKDKMEGLHNPSGTNPAGRPRGNKSKIEHDIAEDVFCSAQFVKDCIDASPLCT